MTDPIKTIVEETLAAAERAIGFFTPNTIRHLSVNYSFSPVEEDQKNDMQYVAVAANNAEKLALMVRELSEVLEEINKVESNRDAAEENEECSYSGELARNALERARAIAAGKGDGG